MKTVVYLFDCFVVQCIGVYMSDQEKHMYTEVF